MRSKIRKKLDQIRAIRANNNDLWMDILTIACEHAPDQTAELLDVIRSNDATVTAKVSELIVDLLDQQKRGVLHDEH